VPKGNINALKHDLYSRRVQAAIRAGRLSEDDLPSPLDPVLVARRVHAEYRRELGRIIASLARVALAAQYERGFERALAEGRPLPEPPLLRLRGQDLKRIESFLGPAAGRATQERSRRAGVLTPDHLESAGRRAYLTDLDRTLRAALVGLERLAAQPLIAGPLDAFFPAPTLENNPAAASLPKSAPAKQLRKSNLRRRRAQDNDSTSPSQASPIP
jgi:hypothetical protein